MAIMFLVCCQPIFADDLAKTTESVLVAEVDAKIAYWKEKADCQLAYRKRVSQLILGADKVEVFLLDFSMEDVEVGAGTFPVSPFNTVTRVMKKVDVAQSDLKTFRDMIAKCCLLVSLKKLVYFAITRFMGLGYTNQAFEFFKRASVGLVTTTISNFQMVQDGVNLATVVPD